METQSVDWKRSTRCESSACVEVAVIKDGVMVRDSKHPEGPVLGFSRTEWLSFVHSLRLGDFPD